MYTLKEQLNLMLLTWVEVSKEPLAISLDSVRFLDHLDFEAGISHLHLNVTVKHYHSGYLPMRPICHQRSVLKIRPFFAS